MSKLVILLVIFTALTVLVSFILPFTYWPEMLNWPFFLNSGWLPYKDFFVIHTPLLIYSLLAFYKVLGFKILTLHIFGTMLLVVSGLFLIGEVFQKTRSVINTFIAGFVFLILEFAFSGNTVWFESFLTPLLFLLFVLLSNYLDKPQLSKIILAGVIFGLALISKQTTAYLLPAIGSVFVIMLLQGKKWPKVLNPIFIFVFTASLVTIFFLIWLSWQKILPDFLYWGVQFVFHKPFNADVANSYVLYPSKRQLISLLLLLLPPVLITLRQRKLNQIHLLAWIGFSLLFAFPRFDYLHLVPMAIFLALFIGENFSVKKDLPLQLIYLAITILVGTAILMTNLHYTHTFVDPDTLKLVGILNNKYSGKTIFSLNGPDQVYFLTKKLPPVRPWVPQLAWYLEPYGSQFYKDFLAGSPEVIFYSPYLAVPVQGVGAYRPKMVADYVTAYYHPAETLPSGIQILTRD